MRPVFCQDLVLSLRTAGDGEEASEFYLHGEMVSWLPFLMNSLVGGLGQVTSQVSLLGLGLQQATDLKVVPRALDAADRHVSFGMKLLARWSCNGITRETPALAYPPVTSQTSQTSPVMDLAAWALVRVSLLSGAASSFSFSF